jgi:hypothetical protein
MYCPKELLPFIYYWLKFDELTNSIGVYICYFFERHMELAIYKFKVVVGLNVWHTICLFTNTITVQVLYSTFKIKEAVHIW